MFIDVKGRRCELTGQQQKKKHVLVLAPCVYLIERSKRKRRAAEGHHHVYACLHALSLRVYIYIHTQGGTKMHLGAFSIFNAPRCNNISSTPPHKSTHSALLYTRLPAHRRAPPYPRATHSPTAAERLPVPAPPRASLSPRRRVPLCQRASLPPALGVIVTPY
jgi:hypothetical protein